MHYRHIESGSVYSIEQVRALHPLVSIPDGADLADLGYEPTASPVVIPASVTMRQARLALFAAGKIALVQQAIDAMPEPQKTAAQITWDYSIDVERHNSFVSQLAPAVGLDDAAVDALFLAAAQL